MAEFLLQLRKLAALEPLTGRTARRAAAVMTFALLTALGAYAAVPLPGNHVPVTLQGLVVILAGALLGPRLGAASQVAYLMAGALGAPVFSGGAAGLAWLFGPTGGYLLAFPAAAALTGAVAGGAVAGAAGGAGARRAANGRARLGATVRLAAACALGVALILVGGTAQLALLGGGLERAIALGVVPFLVGDGLKVVAAILIASRLRGWTLGRL